MSEKYNSKTSGKSDSAKGLDGIDAKDLVTYLNVMSQLSKLNPYDKKEDELFPFGIMPSYMGNRGNMGHMGSMGNMGNNYFGSNPITPRQYAPGSITLSLTMVPPNTDYMPKSHMGNYNLQSLDKLLDQYKLEKPNSDYNSDKNGSKMSDNYASAIKAITSYLSDLSNGYKGKNGNSNSSKGSGSYSTAKGK